MSTIMWSWLKSLEVGGIIIIVRISWLLRVEIKRTDRTETHVHWSLPEPISRSVHLHLGLLPPLTLQKIPVVLKRIENLLIKIFIQIWTKLKTPFLRFFMIFLTVLTWSCTKCDNKSQQLNVKKYFCSVLI